MFSALSSRALPARSQFQEMNMKKLPLILLPIVLTCSLAAAGQNKNSNTGSSSAASSGNTKRRPVFRANKDQIKQAQGILKQRGFYAGEQTGQLDDGTRTGLRKYQE